MVREAIQVVTVKLQPDVPYSKNKNLLFLNRIFLPSGLKVPLSFPAPDRECCIFGLARQKNRTRTMEAHIECLRSHVCQFTCDLEHSLLLLPRCVIY